MAKHTQTIICCLPEDYPFLKENTMNFASAALLIQTVGRTNTILFQGQPGVGKSALLAHLSTSMPDYFPAYIDCTQLDLGDIGMPVVDREAMVTHYAPNARFGLGKGQTKPVLVMLDELGKAAKPVLNMLLPVILERRLGDVSLPYGSIVFATTNLATDGVGDNIPPHAYNRMTVVDFANPTADEWLIWAAKNDIAPEVMAFAKQFPQVFDRYDRQPKDAKNPYIFSPLTGNTRAFCSPRSLAKASHIIAQRTVLGETMLAALIGTVGEAAARDMETLITLSDQAPEYADIIAQPETTRLPEGVGAYYLMAFILARRVTKDTLSAVLQYVARWDSFEASTLMLVMLAGDTDKVGWACRNKAFVDAAAKVGKYF